jgi:hypothetical protein
MVAAPSSAAAWAICSGVRCAMKSGLPPHGDHLFLASDLDAHDGLKLSSNGHMPAATTIGAKAVADTCEKISP